MPLLNRLPPPLLEDIVQNRCLPIIGAGFSLNAILPPNLSMPLWSDLARSLAEQLPHYPLGDVDPIETISAYEQVFGRIKLVEILRRLLHHGLARPGNAHRELCQVPFDIVCTTNFDCLLERGYTEVRRNYRVITDEAQLSLGVDGDTTTLLKIHGDIDRPDRMVLTENDYDRYPITNPLMVTYLSNLLITRTALFIGYSVNDPDLRQILAFVTERLGSLRRPAYVLTHRLRPHDRARYQRRNVECIDLA